MWISDRAENQVLIEKTKKKNENSPIVELLLSSVDVH